MRTNGTSVKTFYYILLVVAYLAGFGWIIYSSEKMWVKIFFGVMGFLLVIGFIARITGNADDKEEKKQ
jgi:hypothetical protein